MAISGLRERLGTFSRMPLERQADKCKSTQDSVDSCYIFLLEDLGGVNLT